MAAGAHELVWSAVLLDGCPNVDVIALRVESDWFTLGHHQVPMIGVDVNARSQADAETLARALRLTEVEGRVTDGNDGPVAWRTWQGWAADGSHEAPVSVTVTGADEVAASAVA
jgi:hypothetical protein